MKMFDQVKMFSTMNHNNHFRNAEMFYFHIITHQYFAIRQNYLIDSTLRRGKETKNIKLKSECSTFGYTKY